MPETVEVHHEHQRIAQFPEGHSWKVLDPARDLIAIVDRDGNEVQRFERGEWSWVGHGGENVHAYLTDDPDCETCHP